MLEAIGVKHFEDLLKGIPSSVRARDLKVPEALSEMELRRELEEVGKQNGGTQSVLSFLGGGSYEHFIPAAVPQLLGRN